MSLRSVLHEYASTLLAALVLQVEFFMPSGVYKNFCVNSSTLAPMRAVSCAMALFIMSLIELISVVPAVSYANDFWPQSRLASCATIASTCATCASALYGTASSQSEARSSSRNWPVFLPVRGIMRVWYETRPATVAPSVLVVDHASAGTKLSAPALM